MTSDRVDASELGFMNNHTQEAWPKSRAVMSVYAFYRSDCFEKVQKGSTVFFCVGYLWACLFK